MNSKHVMVKAIACDIDWQRSTYVSLDGCHPRDIAMPGGDDG